MIPFVFAFGAVEWMNLMITRPGFAYYFTTWIRLGQGINVLCAMCVEKITNKWQERIISGIKLK
jgi:hypothetical protein